MLKTFFKKCKKEIKYFLVLNIIFSIFLTICLFLLNDLFLIGFIIIVFVLCDLIFILVTFKKEKELKRSMLHSFVNLLDYLKFHLNCDNSFSLSIDKYNSSSLVFSNKLKQLLEETKDDVSFAPYLRFAKTFDFIYIESMLYSIYLLSKDMSKESVTYFNKEYDLFIIKYQNEFSKMEKVQSNIVKNSALISAAIIIILIISISVLIIGEYIHG